MPVWSGTGGHLGLARAAVQPQGPLRSAFRPLDRHYSCRMPERPLWFDEVKQGLDEQTAVYEARRCLSCGNCFGCDNCFGVCPDNAVLKLPRGSAEGDNGRDYAFDLDYCKGCGICVNECPSGAIVMIPEP